MTICPPLLYSVHSQKIGKEYEPSKIEEEEHAKEKREEKKRAKKGIKREGEKESERERETDLCPYSLLPSAKVILPSGYLPRQPGWPTQST